MNNTRRKAIDALRGKIEEIKSQIETMGEDCSTIKGEEEDYYDAMPESLQGSDKGQAAENAKDKLEEACTAITEAVEQLEAAVSALEEAKE